MLTNVNATLLKHGMQFHSKFGRIECYTFPCKFCRLPVSKIFHFVARLTTFKHQLQI